MKQISIADFLTEAEIKTAVEIYERLNKSGLGHRFATEFCEAVTKPNIDRISKAVGQECDAKYMAYVVEYALQQSQGK